MKKTIEQKRKEAQFEKLASDIKASKYTREFYLKQLKKNKASKLRIERAEKAQQVKIEDIKQEEYNSDYSEEIFNCEPTGDLILNWD